MSLTLPASFEVLVADEAAGMAAPEALEALREAPERWAGALRQLLAETDAALDRARRLSEDERQQVTADLEQERVSLRAALRRATGDTSDENGSERAARDPGARRSQGRGPARATSVPAPPLGSAPALLQGSWSGDRLVLWGAGPGAYAVGEDDVVAFLSSAGAVGGGWEPHAPVPLPDGQRAAARSTTMDWALGWLVGLAGGPAAGTGAAGAGAAGARAGRAGEDDGPNGAPDVGASVRWLADVAVWATEMVAAGRMVPTLQRTQRGPATGGPSQARYSVGWAPALVDPGRLRSLAARMPGAVGVLQGNPDSAALCRSALAAAMGSICRVGAARLVAPALPPVARTDAEVSEAFMASLSGKPFLASVRAGDSLARELHRWSGVVLAHASVRLVVRLDAPGAEGGWLLSVSAAGVDRHPVALEEALASPVPAKARAAAAHLARLERLMPALTRSRGRSGTRGKVLLSTEEAWSLMTETGPVLVDAGFDVRVPALARKPPGPRLRLTTTEMAGGPSAVGVAQLCHVRWSVVFGDMELDAAEIARLATQARPLVRASGRWVELDRADLAAAADALAQRAATTTLSGGAVLRHALGLEASALGGPVSLEGGGWAADLVRTATTDPPRPRDAPAGFVGQLRDYQAAALGWLAFLDQSELGGCLAMDMGLGKTPTLLAQMLSTRGNGPALVVAPAAVLGNWAAEAARFTPALEVLVHHGPQRAGGSDLMAASAGADLVLTTYGTAVRDVEVLESVRWDRIVVDEAQAIKNPASDTAQSLRRIPARSRLALTGTPIENGLSDLWALLDFTNPGLVGPRAAFVEQLSRQGEGVAAGEAALRALNGLLVFRRTKSEPAIAAELPDKIDELDHCAMTPEQIGLYQAVLDRLLVQGADQDRQARQAHVLAAITALKQVCNHPAAYLADDRGPLSGRSGKLDRLEEIVDAVLAAGERVLVFTHFAQWGQRLAEHLSARTGLEVACYHGGLSRPARDRMVGAFQESTGPGVLVLSLKAGGSGLNLTAANHVVLYDRWWNPAVEDQARDRVWRIGQVRGVVSHRLVCPGTVDERVEEVVSGKRRIADLVLPRSSSLADLDPDQLRAALGLRPEVLEEDPAGEEEETAA